ncbi:FixH family protein [Cohnella abietis]|uniref:Uncharacterized protein n=1 Tax=Cohnella abietis TaxID=2507935 RepID=A0A3T1D7Y5_9BACL|nr:FixH family protein [Cohnella abietis]BBI34165.1 hypothetical protein KCTCHS21_35640 [Cohnella abietis]
MKKIVYSLVILCAFLGAWMYLPSSTNQAALNTKFSDENIRMEIVSNQQVAKVMHENSFSLTLTDLAGKPLDQPDMKVSLEMPSMFCGVIPTTLNEVEPGKYNIIGIPVMSGKWEATVTLVTPTETLHVKHPFISK